MNRKLLSFLAVLVILVASVAEARVGGGRSFGNRGSRGFPSFQGSRGSPYRSYSAPSPQQPQPGYPSNPTPYAQPQRSTFLKSLGAGLLGGAIGSMLFRSLGGLGGVGGGLSGLVGILLLVGLIYWIFRTFLSRPQSVSSEGAATLMREAQLFRNSQQHGAQHGPSGNTSFTSQNQVTPIDTELAMDLFFRVQAAWGKRDLSQVDALLDGDVRSYLDRELQKLRADRLINRLENIAVCKTEVVEAWEEAGVEFSTVRFNANLLDFTVREDTQEVVEGSKDAPVQFEEFWTFSKSTNSSRWKLSAIQQN